MSLVVLDLYKCCIILVSQFNVFLTYKWRTLHLTHQKLSQMHGFLWRTSRQGKPLINTICITSGLKKDSEETIKNKYQCLTGFLYTNLYTCQCSPCVLYDLPLVALKRISQSWRVCSLLETWLKTWLKKQIKSINQNVQTMHNCWAWHVTYENCCRQKWIKLIKFGSASCNDV